MTPEAATSTEPLTAYLFECANEPELLAVCLDPTGATIPVDACAVAWKLLREFPLAVQAPVPAAISPEPVLRGIRAHGYFIWNAGNVNHTFGTSQ
jgi:hypothetical protein